MKSLFIVHELVYYILAFYVVIRFIITRQLMMVVWGIHLHSGFLFLYALFNAWMMPKLYTELQRNRT